MPTSKMTRPLLVGESNPYGSDPDFALYPAPDGCSGHRLCCMILGMWRKDYLESFDRYNLCTEVWSNATAREEAMMLMQTSPAGSRFILLGSKVCAAFRVPFEPFYSVRTDELTSVLVLPHPSRACRMWNDRSAVPRARTAVAEFLPEIAHLIGACER